MTRPLRVAIAEDSSLFSAGLVSLLTPTDVEVVFTASTGVELLAWTSHAEPVDVAILDLRMPPSHTDEGLRAALALRALRPEVGVLLLSSYAETAYAAELLGSASDSVGYLLKDTATTVDVLVDALQRIAAGGTVVDGTIVRDLVRGRRHSSPLDSLTERERGVLRHMAEGRSNAGIATRLNIAEKSVERHIASILGRLALEATKDDNRRVIAVLEWLRDTSPRTDSSSR